jgi:hypothetical protein
MSGALLNQMRIEAAQNVVSGGFETDITITDKADNAATVKGIATLHFTMFDPESGLQVTGRNAHIVVPASELSEFNLYTDTRKPNNINMKDWKVQFTDANGKDWVFSCGEVRPSLTFGMIVIQLVDAK